LGKVGTQKKNTGEVEVLGRKKAGLTYYVPEEYILLLLTEIQQSGHHYHPYCTDVKTAQETSQKSHR
jgi:hypothetical protein